uniref:Putative secreted protein n=1 Tax=Anopheles triannulatus TaxID=58253 RepID=A0A2M4B7W0_9DIPT
MWPRLVVGVFPQFSSSVSTVAAAAADRGMLVPRNGHTGEEKSDTSMVLSVYEGDCCVHVTFEVICWTEF